MIDEGALDELAARGRDVDDATLDERIAGLTADGLATIVYTSGTTGRPKGCMQTHRNLRTNVAQNLDAVRSMLRDDEVTLLFLPLAHTLTKSIALVCVEWGAKLAFATDFGHFPEELALVRLWIDQGAKPTPQSVALRCDTLKDRFDSADGKNGCHLRPAWQPQPLEARVPARLPH